MGNYYIIPLTTNPNQNITVTIPVNGNNITLNLIIAYNLIANYWVMTIIDTSGNVLLDSIPLVTGQYPAADILGQYEYLGLGSAFLVNISNANIDFPTDSDLGTDFVLMWGDRA